MEIIIDSCSVILLAKATILEKFSEWKKTMITGTVYSEVLEGKEKRFLDALLLERLVNEKKIHIDENFRKELVQKMVQDFGLGIGESESIAAASETKNRIVITDNKQGRKAAKIQGLNLSGSIDVVISLYIAKKITKEKALSALQVLKKEGWFQDYLVEYAINEVQNE